MREKNRDKRSPELRRNFLVKHLTIREVEIKGTLDNRETAAADHKHLEL